jgi:LDH2 family malate/lactate/ureidoglycolate dehydrogenase
VISGSAYGRKLKSFHELEGATGVGACFITADIGRFIDPGLFSKLMGDYVKEIKALRKQAGFTEILLPGEVELKKVEESRRLGIDVPETVVSAINEILAKLGSDRRIPVPEGKDR